MSILYAMVPIALLLGLGFVLAFIFASRSGQYDDLETPAHRILLDENLREESPCHPIK